MPFFSAHSPEAFVMLHGGAGPMDPSPAGMQEATAALEKAARAAIATTNDRLSFVITCLEGLEKDSLFNAGYGSALQADGQARLTAAVMDGKRQSFSGVMGVMNILHPSRLALALQDASSRVLAQPGCQELAQRLGERTHNTISPQRLEQWILRKREAISCDTVGAVLAKDQELYVGTSTGGRGFEEPGRISDSATVAGTYATAFAAISATGVGEEIVDDALAARLETRVRDGWTLAKASQQCFEEAQSKQREYGWIAADAKGNYALAFTTAAMSYLVITLSGRILASSYPH